MQKKVFPFIVSLLPCILMGGVIETNKEDNQTVEQIAEDLTAIEHTMEDLRKDLKQKCINLCQKATNRKQSIKAYSKGHIQGQLDAIDQEVKTEINKITTKDSLQYACLSLIQGGLEMHLEKIKQG